MKQLNEAFLSKPNTVSVSLEFLYFYFNKGTFETLLL